MNPKLNRFREGIPRWVVKQRSYRTGEDCLHWIPGAPGESHNNSCLHMPNLEMQQQSYSDSILHHCSLDLSQVCLRMAMGFPNLSSGSRTAFQVDNGHKNLNTSQMKLGKYADGLHNGMLTIAENWTRLVPFSPVFPSFYDRSHLLWMLRHKCIK